MEFTPSFTSTNQYNSVHFMAFSKQSHIQEHESSSGADKPFVGPEWSLYAQQYNAQRETSEYSRPYSHQGFKSEEEAYNTPVASGLPADPPSDQYTNAQSVNAFNTNWQASSAADYQSLYSSNYTSSPYPPPTPSYSSPSSLGYSPNTPVSGYEPITPGSHYYQPRYTPDPQSAGYTQHPRYPNYQRLPQYTRRQSMSTAEMHTIQSSPSNFTHGAPISAPRTSSLPDISHRRSMPDMSQTDVVRMPSPRRSPISQTYTPPSIADADSPVMVYAQQPKTETGLESVPGSNMNPSGKQLYTHRDQLQFFRDAVRDCPMASEAGPFVPQMMYKPHTNSDRRRYVEEVDLEPPIYFWANHPHECGIPLVDALHSRVKRLQNRDECVFEGRGPSVSIRLEWPGYRQWSRQIPTKDFRSPPGPITRAKLAKNVAKCVQRFITERMNHPLEDDADTRFRVGTGPHQIKLEDLILVSIHHVSMGSWQPHLRLRRPFPSSTSATPTAAIPTAPSTSSASGSTQVPTPSSTPSSTSQHPLPSHPQ